MQRSTLIGFVFVSTFMTGTLAADVHHIIVSTPAGGQLVIENIPGTLPDPLSFSQTEIDAGQTVAGIGGWSSTDKSALATLMANATSDGCHRLYKTVNPPVDYECIGTCTDCVSITVVGGTSTGSAVLTLQPN